MKRVPILFFLWLRGIRFLYSTGKHVLSSNPSHLTYPQREKKKKKKKSPSAKLRVIREFCYQMIPFFPITSILICSHIVAGHHFCLVPLANLWILNCEDIAIDVWCLWWLINLGLFSFAWHAYCTCMSYLQEDETQ